MAHYLYFTKSDYLIRRLRANVSKPRIAIALDCFYTLNPPETFYSYFECYDDEDNMLLTDGFFYIQGNQVNNVTFDFIAPPEVGQSFNCRLRGREIFDPNTKIAVRSITIQMSD